MRILAILCLALCLALPARAEAPGSATIVLAGGCFWGMQAVFEHVKGVSHVTAGYAGGAAETAQYHTVSNGSSGHAESVQVVYDPAKLSLDDLFKVYFTVAHDPTQLDRQGPDTGTQYRSEIFFTTPEQKHAAQAAIDRLKAQNVSVVTKVEPLKGFYAAEDYHQDYAVHHPDDPYIIFNDAPKVKRLEKELPALYVK